MKYEELLNENLKRKYKVFLPSVDVDSAFTDAINYKIKNTRYQGFRQGKTPFSYVAKKEAKILDTVIAEQTYKAWNALKKDQKLVIFDQEEEITDINVEAYKKDKSDIEFTVSFELMPNLPQIEFEKLKVKRKTFEVTESDINSHIEELRLKTDIFCDTKEDYTAKSGDLVKIDCQGKMHGKPFKGGTLKDFGLRPGLGKALKEIEDAVIGKKAGQTTSTELTFPQDYHDFTVAGKNAIFDIDVKEIKQAKKAETEEELIANFKYKSKDEFAEGVKKTIEQNCKTKINLAMKDQIEKQLCVHDFMVPEKLLERQRKILKDQKKVKEGDKSIEDEAKKTAKLALIFAKFASHKGLNLQKEDVIEYLKRSAAAGGLSAQYMLQMYQNLKDFAASINIRIMEEKIVSALIDVVQKEDEKSSVTNILKSESTKEENPKIDS